jgi:transposase
MPFQSTRAKLVLSAEVESRLNVLAHSRTEPAQRVERAQILLAYAAGESISAMARRLRTNRPKIERCVNKALQIGPLAALEDLPGRGKPAAISAEARAWVVSLACQKPKDLGYAQELWTTRLLASHIRQHCAAQGHPSLLHLARGTVSKILRQSQVRPHKISYYLERRDPDFEAKMAQVLYVYREVEVLREAGQGASSLIAVLSYDEKPGIQVLENTAPDLPPRPGTHPTIGRDYEYIRHGTLSLMAGIDLLTGHVHGMVVDRHRSREFVEFLKRVDNFYPASATIRIILDNHSAHLSKETRAYLATVPNRFDFVFTPKHGSWLNLVESFFGKLAKTLLRGIRGSSKEELRERIERHLEELNRDPVVMKWTYKLDTISVA